MLALISPEALPALRTAGTIFLIINILGGVYILRNRRRFFESSMPQRPPVLKIATLILRLLLVNGMKR